MAITTLGTDIKIIVNNMTQKQFIESKLSELEVLEEELFYSNEFCLTDDHVFKHKAIVWQTKLKSFLSTALKEIVEEQEKAFKEEIEKLKFNEDTKSDDYWNGKDNKRAHERVFDQNTMLTIYNNALDDAIDQITSRHNEFIS